MIVLKNKGYDKTRICFIARFGDEHIRIVAC